VASYPEDGLTADELLAEADRRMYAHKNSLRHKRPVLPPLAEAQLVP